MNPPTHGPILQGEIRWVEELDQKRRPALVVSRPESIAPLRDVLVIPLTTSIRGLATEVILDDRDGLRRESAANAQRLTLVDKRFVGPKLGTIAAHRWHEVCSAIATATGC